MKKVIFLFIIISNILFGWNGDFAISCGNNGWRTPADIATLNVAWKFGGSGNNPSSGSINKVLTLKCVSSPTLPGEISAGTFYFRIIHLEGTNWFSWGGDVSRSEEIIPNAFNSSVTCPSGNYQNSNSAYFTATEGKIYQILFQSNPNGAGSSSNICVLEFDNLTSGILSLSDNGPVPAGTNLQITINSTTDPPDDQIFWVRYHYDGEDFLTARFVGAIIPASQASVVIEIPGSETSSSVTYYVFTTEATNTPDNSNADKATLWISNNNGSNFTQALPVELSSFAASVSGKSIQLNWNTATEVNNYGFDVERRESSLKDWEKVAFIAGSGNSNSPKNYTYTDYTSFGKQIYRLKQIDNDGQFEYSKEIEVIVGMPEGFLVEQNYPNPFNPTTTIEFVFDQETTASLTIYNQVGELVTTLFNGKADAGRIYNINFNGAGLASGVYYYKLSTPEKNEVRKMLLMK